MFKVSDDQQNKVIVIVFCQETQYVIFCWEWLASVRVIRLLSVTDQVFVRRVPESP